MNRPLTAILLLVAAGLTCFPRLGARDFWPPDEARYGEVSRELLEGAPAALPHLNARIYPDKPPGFFWAVAAGRRVLPDGAPHEAAARLPSAVGAAVLTVVTGWLVAGCAGPGAGLLAGLLFLALGMVGWQARYAQLDMFFAAFIVMGLAAYWKVWSGGSRVWGLLAGLLLFCALFVKGPQALLAPLVLLPWALITRKPRAFFNLGTLGGLVLMGGLTFLWLRWAATEAEALSPGGGQAYLDAAVFDQLAGRAQRALAHAKPWYSYLARLPLCALPFSPLLLLLALGRVRRAITREARTLMGFCWIWLLVFLVPMSLLEGKRDIYLLPVYPALAVLIVLTARAAGHAAPRLLSAWTGLVALALLAVAGAAAWTGSSGAALEGVLERCAPLLRGGRERLQELGMEPEGTWGAWLRHDLLLFALAAMPAAVAALAALFLKAPRAALGWCALASALAMGAACAFVLPDFDPLASRRPAGEMVLAARGGAPGPVAILRHLDEGVLYYSRSPLPEVASRFGRKDAERARREVAAFLARPGARIVARQRNIGRFELIEGRDYAQLDRRRVGRHVFVLMGAPR